MFREMDIPVWNDLTRLGMSEWWKRMADNGMAFHPDDAPSDIVFVADGTRYFDAEACAKLENIYQQMRDRFGDEIYDAGHAALMRAMGWIKPGTNEDWVRANLSVSHH